MIGRWTWAAALLASGLATAAAAQLVPPVGGVVRDVGALGQGVLGGTREGLDRVVQGAAALAEQRLDRLRNLVRSHRDALELTDDGPAVRGEILALDPSDATIAAARLAGFEILETERIEGLDIRSVRLAVPHGIGLDRALDRIRKLAPDGTFSANHLHFQSGSVAASALGGAAASGEAKGASLGIIDGGVAAHPALPGTAEQRGFARGAPVASAHGTAVASLAVGDGPVRGAAPRAHILVADVYGRDPQGGNALALARALGWMVSREVKVVAISLVGPPNGLVAKAVAQAQARGLHIVAAVGNDGPAAPPAYPASYPGVVAVTGVDARNRPLVEAGRALHLDYAAPGAGLKAAAAGARISAVRGTSFAVPLVAGRLAVAAAAGRAPIPAVDAEAEDLGPKGADSLFGRGLVCGACRPRAGK